MMKFELALKGLKVTCKDSAKGKEFNLELEEVTLTGSLDEVKEVVEFLGRSLKSDEKEGVSKIETKSDFHEAAWDIYSDLGKSFEFEGDTYEFIKSDKGMKVLQINGVSTNICLYGNYGKKKFIKFYACEMAHRWNEYDALKD